MGSLGVCVYVCVCVCVCVSVSVCMCVCQGLEQPVLELHGGTWGSTVTDPTLLMEVSTDAPPLPPRAAPAGFDLAPLLPCLKVAPFPTMSDFSM